MSVAVANDPQPSNLRHVQACGARSKRTGKPCQQAAMPNGRCRFHGGKSLAGIGHPSFKGASKDYKGALPFNLLEHFRAAETDPEILNMTSEISLVYARVMQLLGKLDSGEAQSRWADVKETWRVLDDAQKRKDLVTVGQMIAKMHTLLGDADQDYRNWDDIYKALTKLQSLAAQEQKRRVEIHAMMSTDQVVGLVTEIVNVIRLNVDDKHILSNIHRGVMDVIGKRPGFAASVQNRGG